MKILTQERLKELLHYDPETGLFTWKINRKRIKAGDLAGHYNKKNGVHTGIDGKYYPNRHLAWLYMYGYNPKRIFHIDGNPYNNSIKNLEKIDPKKDGPLTQEELKRQLHYDPETGVFTRKITTSSNAKKGDVVGANQNSGYLKVRIHGVKYHCHRLAFLYMEGYLPENEIDHIDRNPSNNAWNNLREVSHACNMKNKKIYRRNNSGITGVEWSAVHKKWKSRIKLTGKDIYLGLFESKLDAAKARWDAEVELGFSKCNAKSSAYVYIQNHEKKEDRHERII